MFEIPDLNRIESAFGRIKPFVNKTPVMTSSTINELTGGEVYFKCENFQKVGAFKFRGACNAILSLRDDDIKNGVVTHSSGNHSAAICRAASIRNIKAYIVMPENAPQVKKDAVAGYGGEITFCESTLAARESTCSKIIAETGAKFIHPYDNDDIISGAATAFYELNEEVSNLDMIFAPIGGGGLMSGTALASKYLSPDRRVIGCEPQNADDAYQSFTKGKLIEIDTPKTIADGLRTMLCPRTFNIIKNYVDEVVTVTEEEIMNSMMFVWERMKMIIEPSSAVPAAVILQKKVDITGKKVGVIVTGGNVDFREMSF